MLAFSSHFSANFQPILHCFIPNFKLKYEDSENMKADRVSFNLHQMKRRAFFLRHPVNDANIKNANFWYFQAVTKDFKWGYLGKRVCYTSFMQKYNVT